MPRANIYIREENVDAWKKLKDKSDWVNHHLRGLDPVKAGQVLNSTPPLEVVKVESVENPRDVKFANNCKVHGTPLDARGKCLQKGCKYA